MYCVCDISVVHVVAIGYKAQLERHMAVCDVHVCSRRLRIGNCVTHLDLTMWKIW